MKLQAKCSFFVLFRYCLFHNAHPGPSGLNMRDSGTREPGRSPCMENGMKRKQLPDFDGTIPLHRIALSGAWG